MLIRLKVNREWESTYGFDYILIIPSSPEKIRYRQIVSLSWDDDIIGFFREDYNITFKDNPSYNLMYITNSPNVIDLQDPNQRRMFQNHPNYNKVWKYLHGKKKEDHKAKKN